MDTGFPIPLPGETRFARICLLASVAFLVAGCASQTAVADSDTLAANPTIETGDLRPLYSAERWSSLENNKYEGYVVMEAVAEGDSLRILKLTESIPDHSRDEMAMDFAGRMKVRPEAPGTFFSQRKRIYAVFYPTPQGSHTALVFSYQPPGDSSTKGAGYRGDAYVTGYEPSSWQLANGSVASGDDRVPDRK